MSDFVDKLNTGILVISKDRTLVTMNSALEKILGFDKTSLEKSLFELENLSLSLENLSKLINETLDGNYDNDLRELKSSTRHKRFEIKVDGSYYNLYLERLANGDYLFELSQIIYQDMNQTTHELKRPIQNIKTLVEVLQLGAKDDATKLDEYLSKLNFEADRLGSMVSDMLNLSHLINGLTAITKTKIDLSSRVAYLLELAESRAKKRNITLINAIDEKTKIAADQKLLDHVLANLIDNAIKYNCDSGQIKVSFENDAIIIADTGMGISADDQAKIFDQFYRIQDRAHIQGSGLGLAMVKAIVDLHDWQVSIDSKLGEGSSFIIKI